LLERLPEEYKWIASDSCEWLPACAYVRGLFEPKTITTHEEIHLLQEGYRELQKAFRKNPNPALAARIFTKGIVLCDNEPFLTGTKGIDFAEIRKDMKSASPELFDEYLNEIGRRKK
jgi:hypothetical protein